MVTFHAASTRSPLSGLMLAAITLTLLSARLWSAEAVVAVFTETFNGYHRTRLPDQSFKTETYAFGEGGMSGLDEPPAGTSKLTFMRVARAAAVPLARANYVPSSNPNETGLLISVFWGRTLGSRSSGSAHSFLANVHPGYGGRYGPPPPGKSSFGTSLGGGFTSTGTAPAASDTGLHSPGAKAILDVSAGKQDALIDQADLENPIFDRIDDSNARILGYSQALFQARHSPQTFLARDIQDEVSRNHYYVVLQAYDFRLAWKEKKLKLLWEARISIQEDDNDFNQSLERMLATATRFFGQDSDGLQRRSAPEGHITTGPLNVLEYSPTK